MAYDEDEMKALPWAVGVFEFAVTAIGVYALINFLPSSVAGVDLIGNAGIVFSFLAGYLAVSVVGLMNEEDYTGLKSLYFVIPYTVGAFVFNYVARSSFDYNVLTGAISSMSFPGAGVGLVSAVMGVVVAGILLKALDRIA